MRRPSGFTLIEIVVAIGLLAVIASLIYGSTAVTLQSQRTVMDMQERYHGGRVAMNRMVRDLSSAFLSKHIALEERKTETLFVGEEDEVLFSYLGHKRVFPKNPESDQGVVKFALKSGKNRRGKVLVRTEKPYIDENAEKGGQEEILAEGVKELRLRYWDKEQEDWTDSWDAQYEEVNAQVEAAQPTVVKEVTEVMEGLSGEAPLDKFRLPERVGISLVLLDGDGKEYRFETQVELRLTEAFAW